MVEIYTDGSSFQGKAGWAYVIPEFEISSKGATFGTNNQAELTAIYHALIWALDNNIESVKVISDSMYSINSLSVWHRKWARQGWPPSIKNQTFLRPILKLQENLAVQYQWVKGYSGDYWNELADSLANSARES